MMISRLEWLTVCVRLGSYHKRLEHPAFDLWLRRQSVELHRIWRQEAELRRVRHSETAWEQIQCAMRAMEEVQTPCE